MDITEKPETMEAQLAFARQQLARIGALTEQLAESDPSAFEDPDLAEALEKFRGAHEEATGRLKHPSLHIATIGTTSSGKSTIVNAMAGRRIAPIESGEMSGGVLVLRDDERRKLIIKEADGAPWQAGEWEGLAEQDAYEKIKAAMKAYHEVRCDAKKRRPDGKAWPAPEVIAQGPLLLAREPQLLGLPKGLGVDFIDLPGLKSTNDADNLKVIQAHVGKAFSIVALDYLNTDEEKREKLLRELEEVVELLGGRTDSMIFVLNRVDLRGSDDDPLEHRIALLQREIQRTLGLETPPEVIPFEARLQYYAQIAWGPQEAPPAAVDQEALKHLFEDCNPKRHAKKGSEERKRIRGWDAAIEDEEALSVEDARRILDLTRRYSGAETLWRRIRERMEPKFAQLVLLPAVNEALKQHSELSGKLKSVAELRQEQNKEVLDKALDELDDLKGTLEGTLSEVHDEFGRKSKLGLESTLKMDVREGELKIELGPGFSKLWDTIQKVENDLYDQLTRPMADALGDGRVSTSDLEEQLQEVITPHAAQRLAQAYDRATRGHGGGFSKPNSIRGKATDEAVSKKIVDAEKNIRRVYQRMREALKQRAERQLQLHAHAVGRTLEGLVQDQYASLVEQVRQKMPESISAEAIFEGVSQVGHEISIELPENLFVVAEQIEVRSSSVREKVGERAVEEKVKTSWCGGEETRTVKEDVIGDVEYQVLVVPSAAQMETQWESGIKGARRALQEKMHAWMMDALGRSKDSFSKDLEKARHLAERVIRQQRSLAETEAEKAAEQWKKIEDQVAEMEQLRDGLRHQLVMDGFNG